MSNSVSGSKIGPAVMAPAVAPSTKKTPSVAAKSVKTYAVAKGGPAPAAATSPAVAAMKASRPAQPTVQNQIDYIRRAEKAMNSKGCPAADRAQYQTLVNEARASLKATVESKLTAARQNCDEKGWNAGSQGRYLDAVMEAQNAYKLLDPKGARANELQKSETSLRASMDKLKDGGSETLKDVEKAVDDARQEGVKHNWNEASQQKYLDAVQRAIGRYKNINPNHPRLKELRQEQDRVRGDIGNAADARVRDAEKKCNDSGSSLDSMKKYLDVVKDARKSYEASGQGDTARGKELEALQGQIEKKIQTEKKGNKEISSADTALDAAYKNCTKKNWNRASQVAYLKAAKAAVKAYETSSPNDPRLANLRQLAMDIQRDIDNLKK